MTRRSGMSLLEIMITLVLVSAMFVPIFWLIQKGTQRVYRGGDETIATIYAADILEMIRGGPYDAFFSGGKTPDENLTLVEVFGRSSFFKTYDPENYDKRFTILIDAGPAGELDPKDLKQVKVRVQWTDRATKKEKLIKMVTFYSPSTL